MTRFTLHYTCCALTLAFIWPAFSQADDTPTPRAKRRPTPQARPARPTTTPKRAAFTRPSPQPPVRKPASLRDLNKLRIPTARPAVTRPAVTRPPAKRPASLRPTGRPVGSAGSAVEVPKRNALKLFLNEVNTQGKRPPARLPNRLDRKILEVDRAGKALRPVITEQSKRKAATDPGKPVKDPRILRSAAAKPEAIDDPDRDTTSGDAVEDPAEDDVPAEKETPADNEQDDSDSQHSCFIVLPGFTFVFGGGTRLVYETLYVEDVIGSTGVHIEETVGVAVEEAISLPEVRAGTTYNLSSENLGNTEGHVVILVNELYLNTTVDQWSNDAATVTLPLVGMVKPQRAALLMMNSKGELVESIDVMFLPAKKE